MKVYRTINYRVQSKFCLTGLCIVSLVIPLHAVGSSPVWKEWQGDGGGDPPHQAPSYWGCA